MTAALLPTRRGLRRGAFVAAALASLAAGPAAGAAQTAGPRGSIAVVSLGAEGWEVAEQVQRRLARHVGGWATQPGIAGALAGRPHPSTLPSGPVGRELAAVLQRLRRGGQPAAADLSRLGQLLSVDYLLLLRVAPRRCSARLFSVRLQTYAPQGFEREDRAVDGLLAYVHAQLRRPPPRPARRRWWVWAAAAAVVTVGIVLAVTAGGDERSGDLRIRVERR